jgi:hypothetical protein
LRGYDIGASIDMAIDGMIYLLQPDGNVAVLSQGGFEREITVGEVTPPIGAVTRFVVTGPPDEGWIFLLDTLNERVIQLDKTTGTVTQQLRIDPESEIRLNQLTDLYVDTSEGRPVLYLINGGQVLRALLPGPPATFDSLHRDATNTPAPPQVAPESLPDTTPEQP